MKPKATTAAPIDNEDIQNYDLLLNKSWTLWGVPAMYNLELRDGTKFKLYRKRLREELAVNLPRESVSYSVVFDALESPQSDLTNFPALKINVVAKSTTSTKEKKIRNIYTGIFISSENLASIKLDKRCADIPLLLSHGVPRVVTAVHSILRAMFGCTVVPCSLSQSDFKWLLLVVLKDYKPEKDELLHLQFGFPGHPASDTVSVDLELSEVEKIREKFFPQNQQKYMNIQRVNEFFDTIYENFEMVFGIRLKKCILRSISASTFLVTENKIKIRHPEHMEVVLSYLCNKTIEELHKFPKNWGYAFG